jgi:hypothetical protein
MKATATLLSLGATDLPLEVSDPGRNFKSWDDGALHVFWCGHLEFYTRCGLSKSEDKLPALGGFANWIQQRLKSEYFAGLWKEHFVSDLL